jgi:hypothetical protein
MVQLSQLPRFVLDLLAACPAAGSGVHSHLFRLARVLHAFYPDKGEMAALIASTTAGCGRDVPASEIDEAIANSEACAWQPGQKSRPVRSSSGGGWPVRNAEQIEAVAAASEWRGLVDLWEASPVRFDDGPVTEALVDALFPGNPLLCCGFKLDDLYGTGTRAEWRGQLADMQFIVPSPMAAEEGQTKKGHMAPRCLDNTGPRRFLVIEFDGGEADTQAAVLWHLSRLAPLALVVHSGGESLHGWFACAGQDEDKLHKFMRYAVLLGADPATWTRCQFVRMPDGLRPRPATWPVRQQVFHFNPHNLP